MARLILHLHAPAGTTRLRVRDGALVRDDDPTAELVDRLRRILAAQGHVTHDDMEGEGHWVTIHGAHVFINGQGVITKGPSGMVGKPPPEGHQPLNVPKEGGTKAKVHALLSAGHGFTFQELSDVLGNPPEKALKNALSELKNPKWAGPKGALDIVKGPDGKFHVKPKEEAATTPAEAEPAKVPAEPPGAPVAAPEPAPPAQPPGAPADAPQAPAPMTYAEAKASHELAKQYATPPKPANVPGTGTKLSVQEADVKYKGKLAELLANAQHAAKSLPADKANDIALAFKQGKANAMAQWKADTTGDAHSAKKQEVFPSDIKLVDNLAHGMPTDEALAKWKADTVADKKAAAEAAIAANAAAAAKVGGAAAPPAKPAAVSQTAATSGLPPDVDPAKPGVPDVPQHVVPHDFKHVELSDFTVKNGSVGATPFSANMNKLKESLYAHNQDSVQNKKGVQARLEARLAESPHFKWMDALRKTKSAYGSLTADLVAQWASSSGDHHTVSCALQLAVKDAFGMADEHVEMKRLAAIPMNGGPEGTYRKAMSDLLGLDPYKDAHKFESFKQGMRDFVRAMYHETQAELAARGITEVCIARGMTVDGASAYNTAEHVKLKLQPASSFSANFSTAHGFSGAQSMFFAKIPASQVLSSYVTGFGCTGEHEVVVLAHPSTEAVKVGTHHASNMAKAMSHIAEQLGAPKAAPKASKPKAPWAPGKKVPAFKHAPQLAPGNVMSKYSAMLKEAAKSGNVAAVQAAHDYVMSKPGNIPHTKAYAQKVLEDMKTAYAGYAQQYGLPTEQEPPGFTLPPLPAGINPKIAGQVLAAAYSKGSAGVTKLKEDLMKKYTSINAPNTFAYVNSVLASLEQQGVA